MTECARFYERSYNDSGLSRDSRKKWSKQAFRRYRLTWLRKNRVYADLERFWTSRFSRKATYQELAKGLARNYPSGHNPCNGLTENI